MYLTIQEFTNRVGLEFTISLVSQRLGMTVDIEDPQAVDLLNITINYASGIIDNYLRKVYILPLQDHTELKYVCEALTLNMLLISSDELQMLKYSDSIKFLENLRDKKIELIKCPKIKRRTYK